MSDLTHHLLLYEYVADMLERRGPYRQEHLARIRAERDAGRIVMAGALGDPPSGGAIVFRGVEPEQIEQRLASGTSIGRLITAAEVAAVIAFLASPLSVAINGDAVACGGGAPRAIHY